MGDMPTRKKPPVTQVPPTEVLHYQDRVLQKLDVIVGLLQELLDYFKHVGDSDVDKLISDYEDSYVVAKALGARGEKRASLREAARIELGLRHFLDDGKFKAFTDTF